MDWQAFSKHLSKLITFSSLSSQLGVNADRWEEIIFHALKGMGQKYQGGPPKWIPGSHAPGADVWTDDIAISAKSGQVKNGKLIISSYRLTRFGSLDEMISFIDGPGKNFDVYLCCAMTQRAGVRTYQIYSVPAHALNARSLDWQESFKKTDSTIAIGWKGIGTTGLEVNIVRNMSNQLWIGFPLADCELLAEITIPLTELGTELDKVLQ